MFAHIFPSKITMLKKKAFFTFLAPILLLFPSSSPLFASRINLLQEGVKRQAALSSSILEDTSNKVTITQLLTPYWQEQFARQPLDLHYNYDKAATYWEKIELTNQSQTLKWLLEFSDPHIEYLKVYWVKNGVLREFPATGYRVSFASREIPHKNFVFELNINTGETTTVYARIYTPSRYCGLDANLRSTKDFASYFLTEYYLLGLYYGIILILVIYNFFLGFFMHEKVHFYYCLYTVCCALFTYAEDGLASQWLWPNLPVLNALLMKYASPLLLVSFLFYSDKFIELDTHLPRIRKYIWGTCALYLFAFWWLSEYRQIQYFLYVLPFFITCLAAIWVYKNGFRAARFFVVGNSMIVLSFIVLFLRISGWIDSNALTVYMFNYAFVFEATILSISLADKVKTTKIQSEKAQRETIQQLRINEELQQKVNKELEGKVQERTKELFGKTQELTAANNKLESLKKELYEMNSKMDLNIWELKKEVKKETEARILNNTLSYEEFLAFYPDNKCYAYLRDLKWKDGYACLKCGNSKFGKGNNMHTFKCTQCQHQQSVTSNTLFHGLKFPISKAFYLVYYLSRNDRKISYEELAEKLHLNKNTVWNFDKKLKESVVSNLGHQAFVPDWQSLLIAKN